MEVITVIPLVRGTHVAKLTYYSSTSYSIGTILDVPVRSKNIRAVVIDSEPVSKAKAAVRTATFSLKKLPEQPHATTLPDSLLQTAHDICTKNPAKVGAVLYALLPPEVREGQAEIPDGSQLTEHDSFTSLLQASEEERYVTYRSKIREAFAHGGSVVFVVPAAADIAFAAETLSKGIEDRVVQFSPNHTPKKRLHAYAAIEDYTNAKLIITTPSHAYLNRHDITTMIVDQCRSGHYHLRTRPYLDHRDALRTFARHTKRTTLMGDILPRSEEEWLRREDIVVTEGEHPKRLALPGKLVVINQNDKPTAEQPFKLFDDKVITVIEETLKNRGRIFMYAARRGLSPVVACADCGHIFRCPDSGTPYSLFKTIYQGEEQRWFVSSTSGRRVRASDTCDVCGGWRLRERGIGIQYLERELLKLFPDAPITVFDSTTATTPQKAQRLIGTHYDTKGAILLGTAMTLPYLHEPHDVSIVTSLDATRSIPTWRNDEELLGLLLKLREQTMGDVLIQTRSEPDDLLTIAAQGAVARFYDDELAARHAFAYPPFSTFVHLSWQGSKATVSDLEELIAHTAAPQTPQFFSAPQSVSEKTKRYALIRIPRDSWPDKALIERLRTLPPSIRIEINPYRII